MICPPWFDLVEARDASGRLPGLLRSHLDACPDCGRRLRVLDALTAALTAPLQPEVPAALRARAVALGTGLGEPASSRVAGASAAPGLGRRIQTFVGSLLGDLGRTPEPALALRGEGGTDLHRLYRAGPYDIDVARLEDGSVVGSVLPTDVGAPGLADGVCALLGDEDPREVLLSANGDFHFERVPPADYDLVLESEGVRLLVPRVDLNVPES